MLILNGSKTLIYMDNFLFPSQLSTMGNFLLQVHNCTTSTYMHEPNFDFLNLEV
jgi:hypothetical protein